MRLRTTCPAMPRTWTVELRSHPSGLVLVCQQCPLGSGRVTATSARSAALTHLARHARGDLLPPHLRTCQCHERGCRWHPRHRGCAGPIRLLLARERGGRLWRLADTCSACAAATDQAAVVPDTATTRTPQPKAPHHRSRRPKGPGERTRVREMLSYLAAALPEGALPSTRLLALQCALRMNAAMHVQLPKGLLRSLCLDMPHPWRELEQACWLRTAPESTGSKIVAELLDATLLAQAPARPDRRRAADWALRASSPSATGTVGALLQLAGVYLAAHTDPVALSGLSGHDQMARACGITLKELPRTLDQLTATGLLGSWQGYSDSGDLRWTLVRRTGINDRSRRRAAAAGTGMGECPVPGR